MLPRLVDPARVRKPQMKLTPTEPFDGAAVDRGQGPSRTSCAGAQGAVLAAHAVQRPDGEGAQSRAGGADVPGPCVDQGVRAQAAGARSTDPSDSCRIRGRRCSGTWTAQSPRKPAGKRDGRLLRATAVRTHGLGQDTPGASAAAFVRQVRARPGQRAVRPCAVRPCAGLRGAGGTKARADAERGPSHRGRGRQARPGAPAAGAVRPRGSQLRHMAPRASHA